MLNFALYRLFGRGHFNLIHMVQVPISIGELLDKLSILNIKSFKILDKEKARMIRNEIRLISPLAKSYMTDPETEDLYTDLLAVNISLWEIEDRLREMERENNFDEVFIELARKVYITNDERAAIKKKINQSYNDNIQEVKQYAEYDTRSKEASTKP